MQLVRRFAGRLQPRQSVRQNDLITHRDFVDQRFVKTSQLGPAAGLDSSHELDGLSVLEAERFFEQMSQANLGTRQINQDRRWGTCSFAERLARSPTAS